MHTDKLLDVKGLSCPLPIVKTKKTIDQLEPGQVLEIHATDKGAKKDLTAWAKSAGHKLIQQEEDNDIYKFWLRKS